MLQIGPIPPIGIFPDPEKTNEAAEGLTQYAGFLTAFAKSPSAFILGAVIAPIVGGLNTILYGTLEAVLFLFSGSCPDQYVVLTGGSSCGGDPTAGTWGLTDIPLVIGDAIVGAGSTIGGSAAAGTGILGVVDSISGAAVGIAQAAGPLGPVIIAAEFAAVVWLVAFVIRRAALTIPGIGG